MVSGVRLLFLFPNLSIPTLTFKGYVYSGAIVVSSLLGTLFYYKSQWYSLKIAAQVLRTFEAQLTAVALCADDGCLSKDTVVAPLEIRQRGKNYQLVFRGLAAHLPIDSVYSYRSHGPDSTPRYDRNYSASLFGSLPKPSGCPVAFA